MVQYILRGDDKHIADIIQENALRVKWGKVEFVPLPLTEEDSKEIGDTDTKEVRVTDRKTTKKSK